MESLIDVLIYIIIIGAAVIVCSTLGCGIFRVANKIRRSDADERIQNNRDEYRAGWRRAKEHHV